MKRFTDIIYERDGGVAIIHFNRPERLNALGGVMQEETAEAVQMARDDRDVRVIVITGKGRAFCAGGDVGALGAEAEAGSAKGHAPFERRRMFVERENLPRIFRRIEKPIIAAVNGPAVGAGCDFAMGCDIRIASDTARFGEVFARLGLFPGTGGTYLLPRIVGTAKALELIWSGEIIDAEEALRIGLVTLVVPADRLLEETRKFAQKFVEAAPIAMALAKSAVYRGMDMNMDDALNYAGTAESITLTSEDHREGAHAFFEKRRPIFKGS